MNAFIHIPVQNVVNIHHVTHSGAVKTLIEKTIIKGVLMKRTKNINDKYEKFEIIIERNKKITGEKFHN
jgi:hypothetical protein